MRRPGCPRPARRHAPARRAPGGCRPRDQRRFAPRPRACWPPDRAAIRRALRPPARAAHRAAATVRSRRREAPTSARSATSLRTSEWSCPRAAWGSVPRSRALQALWGPKPALSPEAVEAEDGSVSRSGAWETALAHEAQKGARERWTAVPKDGQQAPWQAVRAQGSQPAAFREAAVEARSTRRPRR